MFSLFIIYNKKTCIDNFKQCPKATKPPPNFHGSSIICDSSTYTGGADGDGIPGNIPDLLEQQRCIFRYKTLDEAKCACDNINSCVGIVMDKGYKCNSPSGHTACSSKQSFFDTDCYKFELRTGEVDDTKKEYKYWLKDQ